MQVSNEMAIRNAEASLRMEGLRPSPEVLRECKRILDGEITYEQYIEKLKEKYMGTKYATVQQNLVFTIRWLC
ncbi:MAG: antitoxin VbhA family protein [Oscillospiraceae bacterium]|nr:antitoxin VbhA family protein [Oscillospiraceae bacterium]